MEDASNILFLCFVDTGNQRRQGFRRPCCEAACLPQLQPDQEGACSLEALRPRLV